MVVAETLNTLVAHHRDLIARVPCGFRLDLGLVLSVFVGGAKLSTRVGGGFRVGTADRLATARGAAFDAPTASRIIAAEEDGIANTGCVPG